MDSHGNLYWDIAFYAGKSHGEEVCIQVKAYSFERAYMQAQALYKAIVSAGETAISCVGVYLRDDGSVDQKLFAYIYKAYRVYTENANAFFEAGADTCLHFAWCT